MEPPRNKFRPDQTAFGSSLGSGKDFRKHKKDEAPIDESIYDYDAAYDALHAEDNKPKQEDRKPRYMTNILAASEVRKRDQLRARDKVLQKEREAEGDEFAEKEKFVTGAYKEQQEEAKRAEEEERRKEEAEEAAKRKGAGGMKGFYKDLLGRDEERHRAAVAAVESGGDKRKDEEDEVPKAKSEADIAKEMNAKGGNVYINDEGQVADKRQLLGAGLNVIAKPKAPAAAAGVPLRTAGPSQAIHARGSGEKGRRERQTRMLEAQLEESARKAAEEQEAEQKKSEEAVKSKKTKEDISSAKERYLQRKREAAAAAQKTR